ncbi:MAG: hypothetical protein ACI7YS_14805 [Flavobacterium sp.]
MAMKDFKLDNGKKINPGFTYPEGYFDTLSEKITAGLPTQKPKVLAISFSKRIWYYMAAATVTVLFSIPVYNYFYPKNQKIDPSSLENYILYQSTVSEEDIVFFLQDTDLKKINIELNIDDKAIEDALYTNTELEQYLLN